MATKNKKSTNKKVAVGVTIVIILAILGGIIYGLSSTMFGQRMIKKVTSNTTGIQRHVSVYSYNGSLLKEYNGNIVVDDGNGGTISIIVGKDKHTFANATVIITEEDK